MTKIKKFATSLLVIGILTAGWASLNIGYYDTHWAEDNKTVFL